MEESELHTVFASTKDRTEWVEYTVRVHKSRKMSKPYKLNATLAWRSSSRVAAIAGLRGSYASKQEAIEAVNRAAQDKGRELVKVNKKLLLEIGKMFGYPSGRSSYLLEKAVV